MKMKIKIKIPMNKNIIRMLWKIIIQISYYFINLYFPIDEQFLDLLSKNIKEKGELIRLGEIWENPENIKEGEDTKIKIGRILVFTIMIGVFIFFTVYLPTYPDPPH